MNISVQEMVDKFYQVLKKTGFTDERAALCARLFAEATRDGVHSHGLNRFPMFIKQMQSGNTDIHVVPKQVGNLGIIEQWDGQMGVGPLNAHFCMDRAIAIAKEHGMGCAALKNTNHWMRPGAYGLQATEADCIGICWTNTTQFMPLWGSLARKVGSNPLVIAIPREDGPVLLDMALSQFSMGRMGLHRERGEQLPVPGGYDSKGNLTRDPATVMGDGLALPIGYWKGAGLSLALDLIAALLSGGKSAYQIAQLGAEVSVSQVFIAFDMETTLAQEDRQQMVDEVIRDLQATEPIEGHTPPRYPGEGMLNKRKESMGNGIPVDPVIWEQVLEL